ncbi:alanine--glyoxylate aminotransferase 2, mitochondrial-like [Clytia hemisphaerica]|uniref:Alanine--glyoxylate aminotransferase 2, mitochondrial n=1 Tax=Clytia hemisphaerica TaxID=252671 RepID=A0A7M5X6Y6_9CNID
MALFLRKHTGTPFKHAQVLSRSFAVRGVEMPSTDFQPAEFKGMPYDEARAAHAKNLFPHVSERMLLYKRPVYLTQGHMQWLWDSEGKRYLDLFAGIATCGVGHCHPKITESIQDQASKLVHCSNLYINAKQAEYAEKLLTKLPEKYNRVYFVNSGSEANDFAMTMMRVYTGSWDIIGLRNAYHGASPTTLGITNMGQYKFPTPQNFGCHTIPNPDVYKGIWGGKNCRDSPVQADRDCDCAEGVCEATDLYLGQLEDVLTNVTPPKVAGFFGEPIQGVGGSVQYPRDFLQKTYKKIHARGGLCVADEVQTGFGRTGSHYWGFQGAGLNPDIIVCAKTIANGLPMACVITTKEIADSMNVALPFNTYSSNPVSCAAAITALDVIDEEGLQENCQRVGTYCLEELSKIRDDYEIVGDVRGKGLMIGIEMVADKKTRAPLQPERVGDIIERTKDYGVLFGKGGRFGQVLRIKPPMNVTKEDIDFGLAVLRQSIEEHLAQ